jgi:hypothetical protein
MLLAVPSLGNQWPTKYTDSQGLLGADKKDAIKAIDAGIILESKTTGEYVLVPGKPNALSVGETFPTWNFGYKRLSLHNSVTVEIQVGEHNGKPVFFPLRVERDGVQSDVDKSLKRLTEAMGESLQKFDLGSVQVCAKHKKCVKYCTDDHGKRFCCRYECSEESPQ